MFIKIEPYHTVWYNSQNQMPEANMNAASAKATISGIVGLLGAGSTAMVGQAQISIPIGFGLFLITLLIQYDSIKIKIMASFATFMGFLYFILNGGTP